VKSRTRRIVEMGRSVVAFSEAHPDPSPGYQATLSRLKDRLARAAELIKRQREGFALVRGATKQKLELRRIMVRTQLQHVLAVAELAAAEVPDLLQKFVLPREQVPYLEFQAAAHVVLAEALSNKELLVKFGLADTLLDDLVKNLETFDRAMAQGSEARQTHVSARAELDAIADEILHLVRVLDTFNRSRFRNSVDLLTGWEHASNVFGPIHPSEEEPAPPVVTPPTPPQSGGESTTAA